MHYLEHDWIDIVTTCLERTVSTWLEKEQQKIQDQLWVDWASWIVFKQDIEREFAMEMETNEACQHILNLRRFGQVVGYVQRFQELLCKIPNMRDEEAYTLFLCGLHAEMRTLVCVNSPRFLEADIA